MPLTTLKLAPRLYTGSLAAFATVALLLTNSFSQDRPFSREELLQYMRANLPAWTHPDYNADCEKLVKLIRRRGIDFEASLWKFDAELHKAGANTAVKIAIAESYRGAATGNPGQNEAARERASGGIAQPGARPSGNAGASIPQPVEPAPTPSAPSPKHPADAGNMDWRVGDEVEAWINVDWLPGKILQVGGGPFPEHPYKVQYGVPIGGIYAHRWLSPQHVRVAERPSDAGVTAPGPRPGRYTILSYGSPTSPPIRLGYIDLNNGGYRYLDAAGYPLGEGRFSFDEAAGIVQWQSGPLRDQGWSGTFTVERDGKTHKIRLMRSTIATNSAD